jgi:hypothetical protein
MEVSQSHSDRHLIAMALQFPVKEQHAAVNEGRERPFR